MLVIVNSVSRIAVTGVIAAGAFSAHGFVLAESMALASPSGTATQTLAAGAPREAREPVAADVMVPCGEVDMLIKAIIAANTAHDPTTIVLNADSKPKCTYSISKAYEGPRALPPITGKITLKGGPGQGDESVIERSKNAPDFCMVSILGPSPDQDGQLTLDNITIANGNCSQSGAGITLTGGVSSAGIRSGKLTLKGSSAVVNNTSYNGTSKSAASGGGISNLAGTVIMNDTSSVTHNTVKGALGRNAGGGILNAAGVVVLNNASSVSDNTVTKTGNGSARGGGIYNVTGGRLELHDVSTVIRNTAASAGGVYNNSYESDKPMAGLYLDGAAYIGNNTAASGSGGGVVNAGSSRTELKGTSLISENVAKGSGGGIWADSGRVTVAEGSSIKGNTAKSGGGVYNGGAQAVTLAEPDSVTGNKPNNCAGETVAKCQG